MNSHEREDLFSGQCPLDTVPQWHQWHLNPSMASRNAQGIKTSKDSTKQEWW